MLLYQIEDTLYNADKDQGQQPVKQGVSSRSAVVNNKETMHASTLRFHPYRVARGNRDHRHSGGHPAPRARPCPRSVPPGQLREWQFGEYLPVGVHDIWFHENGSEWWRFQLVLAETDGDAWYFRKDRAICGLRQGLVAEYHGTPCVRIDVQLFYKSRSNRERDTYDFQACLPLLDSDQRRSLQRMISRFITDGHKWLSQL